MEFEIRPIRADDAERLSAVIRGLGLFGRLESEDPDVTAARVAEHVRMCLADDSHSLFVAESDGAEPIGYAAVHWLPYLILPGPEGYVSELFVAESARDRGVGTALLDTVASEARRRGCARLMLAAVRTRESYLRGFYVKHGWIERDSVANMVFDL
jgi:GNAT superfamily N-acetyltransferase